MYEKDNKEYFEAVDFDNAVQDVKTLIDLETKNIHLVTLYRGGLPLGVRLSNEFNLPLSIINYQRLDGNGDASAKFMYNAGIQSSDCIFLVDDIADHGISLRDSLEFLRMNYPETKIVVYSIYGNDEIHDPKWKYSVKHTGKWVVFIPWEGK